MTNLNTKATREELSAVALEHVSGGTTTGAPPLCSPFTALAGAVVGGALTKGNGWGVGAGAVAACAWFPSNK
jgi:hypothetical protein